METEKNKTVYVNYTNTDRTEGRGQQVIHSICETRATAEEEGRKGGVMGTPCEIIEKEMIKGTDGLWYFPDDGYDPAAILSISTEELHESIIDRAKSAGLTDADIEFLRTTNPA